ncbi:hypothetical protein EJ110_NYTH45933 [Nymphaea thermarum]|nr:hypothetical protein EJ110_NYTH45933 [Nymphaea thermarum]
MGWAIALHEGAGDISPSLMPPHILEAREECLRKCLHIGISALNAKATALDVVELVVREMENHPLFNAGRGSVLTTDGTVEMEASIMDTQRIVVLFLVCLQLLVPYHLPDM